MASEGASEIYEWVLKKVGGDKYNRLIAAAGESYPDGELRFWQAKLFRQLKEETGHEVASLGAYVRLFRDAPKYVPAKEKYSGTEQQLRDEWRAKGREYARAIADMVAFGEKHGWDKWKGPEPEDGRELLAAAVLDGLRAANQAGEVAAFREKFPPAHAPFVSLLDDKGQAVSAIIPLGGGRVLVQLGTEWLQRSQWIIDGTKVEAAGRFSVVGASMNGNIFATSDGKEFRLTRGWEGELVSEFASECAALKIAKLTPFNDGKRLLLVSNEGIWVVSEGEEVRIHPSEQRLEELAQYDEGERDDDVSLDMAHAALSPDNRWLCAGDQCSEHLIYNEQLEQVAEIGPQGSSYPHFCLFAEDSRQLIFNSCHFYNGVTNGIDTASLSPGLNIGDHEGRDLLTEMDEESRLYAGISVGWLYIVGDAYGYIRAIDRSGKQLWRHFLGSTIDTVAYDSEGDCLLVGTYAGVIHRLRMKGGPRDDHTIGNSPLWEEWRLLMWRGEKPMYW